MSTDPDKIDLGPQNLAEAFVISPEQWFTLQVGMARLLHGKRMGLTDADYNAALAIARQWLQDVGPASISLVEDLRTYGQAHTQKFGADKAEGDVNQMRADIQSLHQLASGTQAKARSVFDSLRPLSQSCASLKQQLIEQQMWTDGLDENLDVMQTVIEKMTGVWGALAADLNDLANMTDIGQLSRIMTKVKDGGALREWNTVISEAATFLANAVQVSTSPSRFGQGFTNNEGNSSSAGLCGDMENGLQLGAATNWYVMKCSDGSNYILAADSWQCLTVERDSNTGFLYPALRNADGDDNQHWMFVPATPGGEQIFIVSKANGQCLASEADEDGGAHLLTTQLVDRSRDGQSYDSGKANLRWSIWQAD